MRRTWRALSDRRTRVTDRRFAAKGETVTNSAAKGETATATGRLAHAGIGTSNAASRLPHKIENNSI